MMNPRERRLRFPACVKYLTQAAGAQSSKSANL
jgi:hypothetical protein